jgi:hypothetical protein
MSPYQGVTPAFLAVEPLLNRVIAFGEILMAAGTSPAANITPSSIAVIGGDITEAASEISSLLKSAFEAQTKGK